jgi:UDP-N-acetyl-D-mannosaminuronic acid transferase (WecB/TagA/CpsF family)
MARITIKDVKTSLGVQETYDIVNAITNSSGDSFQQYVPLANSSNVADIGAGIMITQAVQNEFIVNLIDRIGLVIVKRALLANPLKKFKKGQMQQGRTIEEILQTLQKRKSMTHTMQKTLFSSVKFQMLRFYSMNVTVKISTNKPFQTNN